MSGLREQRRSDSRQRIVDAAWQLFAASGADGVTMAEVAQAADVSRATVFNHFGSKHALIEGLTEGVLVYYQTILDSALADAHTPTPELIRAMFALMGRGIEEEARFYRGVFREIAKVRVGMDEGSQAHRAAQAALERLVRLLARGQERDELSQEYRAEDLASAFDSLVNGTITHWLYDDASEPLEERMKRVAEVFLGGVAVVAPIPFTGPAPQLIAPRARRNVARPSPKKGRRK